MISFRVVCNLHIEKFQNIISMWKNMIFFMDPDINKIILVTISRHVDGKMIVVALIVARYSFSR